MEWAPDDRAYALAYQDYERLMCSGCGQEMTESTARENQYAYGGEIVRCHSCAAQARTVERFIDDGGERAGVMYRMTESPKTRK